VTDEERKPSGSQDQGPTGEEKAAHGPDERQHTVTYSRRRFIVMLGGAAVVATGFYELARQFGGPTKTGRGGQRRMFSDFPVTSIDSPPHVLLKDWTVQIAGLVEKPTRVDHSAWSTLPRAQETVDFHCVEGWSVSGLVWAGVRPADLLALAGPLSRGRFVRFIAHDGDYFDTLSMEQLNDGYSLLADSIDGVPLPPEHGGPLRLVVPTQLGYKSVKFVNRIEVVDHQEKGYWEQRGYAVDAPATP
jgi:DMSO/TMAO reductase YedYZ molybdopterin-dependent catalytic subunit